VPAPATAVAIDHPPTRAAIQRRWLRALAVSAAAVALLAPVVVVGPEDWDPAPYALMVGVPLLALGGFMFGTAGLVQRAARRYPWQLVTARYQFVVDKGAVLDATTSAGERLLVRIYTPNPARQKALRTLADGGEALVAVGDHGLGVVALPPGEQLTLGTRPPKGSRRERHLDAIARR
jgi:hypothetical protein